VAEVTISTEKLDSLGMVVDFGVLSKEIGGWLDEHWDHAFLYHQEDDWARCFATAPPNRGYAMASNPTAENMAEELFKVAERLVDHKTLKVERVRMYETPGSWADYPLESRRAASTGLK
jgi:6-pyruvoyltetrahydropterin/6-carboxytetrahydropterin synthase